MPSSSNTILSTLSFFIVATIILLWTYYYFLVDSSLLLGGGGADAGWKLTGFLIVSLTACVVLVQLYKLFQQRRRYLQKHPFFDIASPDNDLDCWKAVRGRGRWIVIANATFDYQLTIDLCHELIRVALSATAEAEQKRGMFLSQRSVSCDDSVGNEKSQRRLLRRSSSSMMGVKKNFSRRRLFRRDTSSQSFLGGMSKKPKSVKLNILLIGEDEDGQEENEDGGKEAADDQDVEKLHHRLRRYRSVNHLAEEVRKWDGWRALDGDKGGISSSGAGRRVSLTVDVVVQNISSVEGGGGGEEDTNESTVDNNAEAELESKLGHILVDGGVGLCILCPPGPKSTPISSSSKESSRLQQRYNMQKSVSMIQQSFLPHMKFRNIGAIIQILAGSMPSAKEDPVGKNGFPLSVDIDERSEMETYQTQLLQSLYHKNRKRGIDILCARVPMLTSPSGEPEETTKDMNTFAVGPSPWNPRSSLMGGGGWVLRECLAVLGKKGSVDLTKLNDCRGISTFIVNKISFWPMQEIKSIFSWFFRSPDVTKTSPTVLDRRKKK